MTWAQAQIGEAAWWGDCRTTLTEDLKQIEIAPYMGLEPNQWLQFDLDGRHVVDLGGGPASLLLKCQRIGGRSTVIDPCLYPDWTLARYAAAGITVIREPVESIEPAVSTQWDEAWCYNVLQHVIDPERFLEVALGLAPVLRIFEWINIATDHLHPHTLTRERLEEVLGLGGHTSWLENRGGEAFYGVFTRQRVPA